MRVKKSTTKHEVSIRLGSSKGEDEEMKDDSHNPTKRRKHEDGAGAQSTQPSRKSSVFNINTNV